MFENENDRTAFSKYYVPNVPMEDFNLLIDGKRFFDMLIKNKEEPYEQMIEMGKKKITRKAIYWIMSTFQTITN